MTYKEIRADLFDMPEHYYLAHCISADFGMGKGIAVAFNEHFNMRNRLKDTYPYYLTDYKNSGISGDCILIDRVCNLITKKHYWDKPTYGSLSESLDKLREICIEHEIKHLAMPLIGCGLDRLEWNHVSNLIKESLGDLDINIVVCIK